MRIRLNGNPDYTSLEVKRTAAWSTECPQYLEYPEYKTTRKCLQKAVLVWPLRELSGLKQKPLAPVMNDGVVFYVYSWDFCKKGNLYMEQLKFNIDAIHEKDPNANVALVTNCNIPLYAADGLSVIVPVHKNDLVNTSKKQWNTRMLYNAYLPFNYSYILDTHVFPCHSDSYSRLFSLFSESDVDIAASNRVAGSLCVTGGGILSKWGNRSHNYWTTVYRIMNQRNTLDDQAGMRYVHLTVKKHPWKFRWMSSNWFWASHGINENGKFVGNAKCYRSSVVATGPIKWIHGSPSQCELMNGPNNTYAYKERCYYWRQNCNMVEPGPLVVFSKKGMDSLVAPYKAPPLEWNKSKAADSLFWDLCVCSSYSCDGI